MRQKNKNFEKVGYIVFAVMMMLLICRTMISNIISISDEMSYISAAHRLYKGDIPIVDIWSLSGQTNGILLMPFVFLYCKIVGDTTGIALAFRLLYLAIKLGICIYIYSKIKNTNHRLVGFMAILMFMVFSTYNIDSLSYNTVPVIVLFLIIFLQCREDFGFSDSKKWFFSALLLGVSVVSNPFMIFVSVIPIPFLLVEKKYRPLLSYLIGMAIVGLCGAIFILSKTSISDIISVLPYVLGESSHAVVQEGNASLLHKLLSALKTCLGYSKLVLGINVLTCLIICIYRKQKDNFFMRNLIFTSLLLSELIVILKYVQGSTLEMINYPFLPFAWTALELLILIRNKKKKRMFTIMYCLTVGSVIAIFVGTVTCLLAASSITVVFPFLIYYELEQFEETVKQEKIVILDYAIVLAVVIVTHFFILWQGSMPKNAFSNFATDGPLAYTFFPKDAEFASYQTAISDLKKYKGKDIKYFAGSTESMTNVYMDTAYGSMGCYFQGNIDISEYERLRKYFSLHPEKFPDVVYYMDYSSDVENTWFMKELYTLNYDVQYKEDRILATKN